MHEREHVVNPEASSMEGIFLPLVRVEHSSSTAWPVTLGLPSSSCSSVPIRPTFQEDKGRTSKYCPKISCHSLKSFQQKANHLLPTLKRNSAATPPPLPYNADQQEKLNCVTADEPTIGAWVMDTVHHVQEPAMRRG